MNSKYREDDHDAKRILNSEFDHAKMNSELSPEFNSNEKRGKKMPRILGVWADRAKLS